MRRNKCTFVDANFQIEWMFDSELIPRKCVFLLEFSGKLANLMEEILRGSDSLHIHVLQKPRENELGEVE